MRGQKLRSFGSPVTQPGTAVPHKLYLNEPSLGEKSLKKNEIHMPKWGSSIMGF